MSKFNWGSGGHESGVHRLRVDRSHHSVIDSVEHSQRVSTNVFTLTSDRASHQCIGVRTRPSCRTSLQPSTLFIQMQFRNFFKRILINTDGVIQTHTAAIILNFVMHRGLI
jgi:hypothetical protein